MEQAPLQGDDSKWKVWSLGTVTEDKPFGVDIIQVSTTERLPMQSGPMGSQSNEYAEKVPTTDGIAGEQNLKTSKVVQAEWVPDGDNHLFTSPMVRKNEVVKIYKFADDEKYYWTTIFRSPQYRRTERFILAASNLSGGSEAIDMDSIYYIDVNTLDKNITIQTSLSDGEEFMYQFCLDPRSNSAWLADNVGNKVGIDSSENNVYMEDAIGAKFETRAGHPKITGVSGFLLTSPSNVIEGPTEFKDSVIVRKTLTSVGLLTLNSGMAMEAGNGGSGGKAVFDGEMIMNKPLTVNSTSTFQGYATFNGGHTPDD